MFYLGNAKCNNGIICNLDVNQISIFEDIGCKGISENISINYDNAGYNSTFMGTIDISRYDVVQSMVKISWITSEPQNSLIPRYNTAMDFVALFDFVGTMIICVCSMWYYSRVYVQKKKKQDLLFALNQFFIAIRSIFSFIYLSMIFQDDNTINYFTITRELTNIQTLFSSKFVLM